MRTGRRDHPVRRRSEARNGVKQPDITSLEFMLGMMADPNVDPSLRFKAAQASAMYVHPKPTGVPGDAAEAAKTIESVSLEAAKARLNELHRRSGFDIGSGVIVQDELTTAAERLEYNELSDHLETPEQTDQAFSFSRLACLWLSRPLLSTPSK